MNSFKDVLLQREPYQEQRERYQDLLREAEKHRHVRQVLAGRQRRQRAYCRAINWLGRRMVAWGQRLQEHYGATATVPALQAANYQP